MLHMVSRRTWAVVAIATAVVTIPATLLAWGPSRPTYTQANPADHITFNSITDAPNYGDERNFVMISQDKINYSDDITVTNGQEYYVRIYVHNNAATNLNLVAHDVVAKLNVPTQMADRIQVDGYVNSSNASPTSVWDQAVFHGANDTPFTLSYVPGSAYYQNAKGQFTLPDSIVGDGATLGYDKMDGNIPGCFDYSGVVYLKVKAQTADFAVSKTVRKAETGSFGENVTVNPGDKVDYQLYFKNTGGIPQTTVTIKDLLPAGMTYVPGTTYVHDDQGTRKIGDSLTTSGISMGNYSPNGDVYLKFTAQAADNDKLAVCGTNTLVNTMSAITAESGTKTDTATVTVNKNCVPTTHPAITITKTVNNKKSAEINTNTPFEYELTVKNTGDTVLTNAKVSDAAPAGITFVSAEKGTITNNTWSTTTTLQVGESATFTIKAIAKSYIADAVVNTACVDASEISGNPDACDKASTTMPAPVEACNLDTMKIEQKVDQSKIDGIHYTTDLSKCTVAPSQVTACNIDTGTIETVDQSKIDNVHYTTDRTKCEETVCRISDNTTVTIARSEFNSDVYTVGACSALPSAPVTATELPHTGMSTGMTDVIGLGSLIGVVSAFIASRRTLNK